MHEIFSNIPLQDNKDKNRFEITHNDYIVFTEYKKTGSQMALTHTEAAPELKGTGAAAALVEKTFQHLEKNNLLILPFCPYIFGYIKKNPDWKRIVDKRFKKYDQL